MDLSRAAGLLGMAIAAPICVHYFGWVGLLVLLLGGLAVGFAVGSWRKWRGQ